MKLTNMLIGTALVCFVIVVISFFIVDTGRVANKNTSSLNLSSSYNAYNRMENIYNDSKNIYDVSVNSSSKPQNLFDIIGGFFSSGLSLVKTTANSISLTTLIVDEGINQIPMGDEGSGKGIKNAFKVFISLVLFIMIGLGIFAAILIGDRGNKI